MKSAKKFPTWLNEIEQEDNLPAWFAQMKLKARDDFLTNGLPNPKDERFKYTDLTFLENALSEVRPSISPRGKYLNEVIDSYRLAHEACILLVFVNGYFVKELSDIDKIPQPVKVYGLQDALVMEGELIQKFFALHLDSQKYPFAHLNRALCKDGLLIYLPAHYALTTPIYLLSLVTDSDSFIANPHHMILLNSQSKLTLIEEYVSLANEEMHLSKQYMMNTAMTTLVGNAAAFTHYKIQHEGKAAVHMAHHFIHQKQDSNVNLMNFSFGGTFSRDEVSIHLEERGASCQTNGFYRLRQKNQYIDHHVDIDHEAPYSTSEMHYKGIIGEARRAVFNGRLHVHRDAQKVVAHQENHHLLLGEGAESFAKPELMIYADDVKCKHGATTGEVDDEALFYLCSRGISKEEAIEMLLQGFAASIIDRILLPSVKSRVTSLGMQQ